MDTTVQLKKGSKILAVAQHNIRNLYILIHVLVTEVQYGIVIKNKGRSGFVQ